MSIWTTVLYKYVKSHRNDVHNLYSDMHMRSKLYLQFYHYIVYIAKEGRHIRIYIYHNYHNKWVYNIYFIIIIIFTDDTKYLWQAIVQLEKGMRKSISNFHIKVLLMRLYCIMGKFFC